MAGVPARLVRALEQTKHNMTAMKSAAAQPEFGFSYRATSGGAVCISRNGREVATLRSEAASRFLSRAEVASPGELQMLCAKATGNYKRGNESAASSVRRSKGRDD